LRPDVVALQETEFDLPRPFALHATMVVEIHLQDF